jgi:branched-chain amino acid transport system permease protein
MQLTLFFQQIVNGLSIGSVYAIFALGYTLVFSILGIINFSHSAVFTLGAYLTYALVGGRFSPNGLIPNLQLPFGLPFPIAALVGATLAGFIAVAVERVAFRPLRARGADPLLTLVSSLGVAIALVNTLQYLFGAEPYSFPVSTTLMGLPPSVNLTGQTPPLIVRTTQLILFAVSMVSLIALTYFINATKVGKALRAVAEDPTTASLLGINTDRLILITFFLSGFLGGLAGTLIALSVSITGPYFGIAFGLKGLAVMVLGGLGSIPGAVVGGMVIGFAEAFVPAEFNAYKDAVAFALLFIFLLVRPQGLLGRPQLQKV